MFIIIGQSLPSRLVTQKQTLLRSVIKLFKLGRLDISPELGRLDISPEPPIIILCSIYKNCHWRTAGVEVGQSIYGSWVSKRILILRDRIPNSLTFTQDP